MTSFFLSSAGAIKLRMNFYFCSFFTVYCFCPVIVYFLANVLDCMDVVMSIRVVATIGNNHFYLNKCGWQKFEKNTKIYNNLYENLQVKVEPGYINKFTWK